LAHEKKGQDMENRAEKPDRFYICWRSLVNCCIFDLVNNGKHCKPSAIPFGLYHFKGFDTPKTNPEFDCGKIMELETVEAA